MAQTSQVRGVATSIRSESGNTIVRYHATDVVTFSAWCITLDSGGHRSNTTRTRMAQASNQFALGVSVFQRDWNWYVGWRGETYPFTDGMMFNRVTGEVANSAGEIVSPIPPKPFTSKDGKLFKDGASC